MRPKAAFDLRAIRTFEEMVTHVFLGSDGVRLSFGYVNVGINRRVESRSAPGADSERLKSTLHTAATHTHMAHG